MINVEDLLKPVADDKPCGEDFTYHPSLQNLETLSHGKGETQFSAAEEPDWKEVRDGAIEVLGNSKHLSASVILTLALMRTGGIEGLRDGLAVLHGLVEKYWGDLYPKLDPEDNNDPTERLNILNNLSTGGEPYRFTARVKQLVICESPGMGRITLQQILATKEAAAPAAEGKPASTEPDAKQIDAAFRDAGAEAAKATLALVNDLKGHAEGLDGFLDTTLGSGKGVNFQTLLTLIGEIKSAIEPYASDEAPAGAPVTDATAGAGGGRAAAGGRISGAIGSRADVIKALDLICDYYRATEPSSPVPLILQRAQRLVDMDFMAIVTDLTPDALSQLQVITGTKSKE